MENWQRSDSRHLLTCFPAPRLVVFIEKFESYPILASVGHGHASSFRFDKIHREWGAVGRGSHAGLWHHGLVSFCLPYKLI